MVVGVLEHRLKIVYHRQWFDENELAHRVRRELSNQSPHFDQALYIVSVPEEKPAGLKIAKLEARDPEHSPVCLTFIFYQFILN